MHARDCVSRAEMGASNVSHRKQCLLSPAMQQTAFAAAPAPACMAAPEHAHPPELARASARACTFILVQL